MKNMAYLYEYSPFYELFPDGVPIKNILLPTFAICEGDGQACQAVFMVDLDQLRPEQFDRLVAMVHQQCDPQGRTSIEVSRKEIQSRGLPLRAKHVRSVSSDCPFFL
jgi:hypothetical protein